MIFDVVKANDKNNHDAADIICEECKSIIATLHGPSAHRPGVRTKRAAKAREMASQEIDRLSDPSATDEERQRRKRRLLKGPKEFRDVRGDSPRKEVGNGASAVRDLRVPRPNREPGPRFLQDSL
jgi:hypothetical protein